MAVGLLPGEIRKRRGAWSYLWMCVPLLYALKTPLSLFFFLQTGAGLLQGLGFRVIVLFRIAR